MSEVREKNKATPPVLTIVKKGYDPTDNKWRGYRFSWVIYPDYWKSAWGPKPILGYVRADSEFHAKYAAYDRGLLIPNATFGPEPVKQTKREKERSNVNK